MASLKSVGEGFLAAAGYIARGGLQGGAILLAGALFFLLLQ